MGGCTAATGASVLSFSSLPVLAPAGTGGAAGAAVLAAERVSGVGASSMEKAVSRLRVAPQYTIDWIHTSASVGS